MMSLHLGINWTPNEYINMLTKSKDFKENYCATIVQLGEPIKHPKANRLQCFLVQGNKVITDLSYSKGEICVFFPLESKLNPELLSGLNMYSDGISNANPAIKGYVGSKSRIRAVKLREEPSMGLVLKIVDVEKILGSINPEKLSYNSLVGQEFDTWNSKLICEKYIPPMNQKGWAGNPLGSSKNRVKRFDRMIDNQFRLHEDTTNLRKNIHKISPNDIISISMKMHGTSWVCGNVLVKRKLSIRDRIAKWFGVQIKQEEYDILYSSRSVIKNKFINDNPHHYYGTDLWGDIKACLDGKIPRGFTLYGECVGWTRNGAPIQKSYDYGYMLPIGDTYIEGIHYGIYVYRITQTNVDGTKTELSWGQIKEYCAYYNIKHVPEFYYGYAKDWDRTLDTSLHWNESFLQGLEKKYLEQICSLCSGKIPSEGIVVSTDNMWSMSKFKLKSWLFLEKETQALDNNEINIEDEQSLVDS